MKIRKKKYNFKKEELEYLYNYKNMDMAQISRMFNCLLYGLEFNSNNLISLCHTCHGQTQLDRQGWIEYFQDKIGEINQNVK